MSEGSIHVAGRRSAGAAGRLQGCGLRQRGHRRSGIAVVVHQAGLADRIADSSCVRIRQYVVVTEDILHATLGHQRAERAGTTECLTGVVDVAAGSA